MLKKENGSTPNIPSPKNIMMTPPMFESIGRAPVRFCPIRPARAPKLIKTIENPTIKNKPFKKIDLFSKEVIVLVFVFCTPLIKAIYAGMRGRVHGAKKVSIPAMNAEIIKLIPSSKNMYTL